VGFFYVSIIVTLLCVTPKRSPPLTRLIISLLVTLALVVPIAYLVSPWVYRQVRIGALTSDIASRRQRALTYLVAKIDEDPVLFDRAVDALNVKDSANFLQIVDALQTANRWDRPDIPDDAWLRWITLHAHEPGTEAPAMAAQRLADLQDLADDQRLTSLLAELSNHTEPDVRYNALCAAAELFMSAKAPAPYHDIIAGRLNDPEPVTAHHAQIFVYLTDTPGVEPPAWLQDANVSQTDTRYDKPAILALLHSPDAPLRDVGCVLAVRDLGQEGLAELTTKLLNDERDHVKISGAMLSGISGLHNQTAVYQIDQQTDWVTQNMMMLGLWMNDTTAGILSTVLLAHGDPPRTTVILAMLHRRDPLGLEVLLNPRGEVPDDLAVLLEDYGWWRVLDRYLPVDAPRWQSGTDKAQQQQQIDLLRDWYLVNRHRLKQSAQTTE
jgi:hypothetical protein